MSSVVDRFWSFVSHGEAADCWEWHGGRDWDGYGIFSAEGKSHRAHRWSYESLRADIPTGLVIDHLCRNPSCVNPWHMEPVTNRVNIIRGTAPPAANAKRTHCPHGHKLNADRNCRTCDVWFTRIHRGWTREAAMSTPIAVPPAARVSCPQGHQYDDENTYYDANGNRHCRTCHRDRQRARYHARKAAQA